MTLRFNIPDNRMNEILRTVRIGIDRLVTGYIDIEYEESIKIKFPGGPTYGAHG
ncbi:1538_t:CDS:1, partial [Gigaspora margarita]